MVKSEKVLKIRWVIEGISWSPIYKLIKQDVNKYLLVWESDGKMYFQDYTGDEVIERLIEGSWVIVKKKKERDQ